MSIKLKFTLIILVTLILGIAIGFEISEILVKMRQNKIDSFREANGFVFRFEDIIQPTAEQKPAISSILLKYHKLIDSTSKTGMTQVSSLIDTMITKLKANLNEDQLERLDNEIKRMKNGPHPPPMDQERHNMEQNRGPLGPGNDMGPNQRRDFPPREMNRPGPFERDNKLLKPGDKRPPEKRSLDNPSSKPNFK